MHGIHQHHPLSNPAFAQSRVHVCRYVDKRTPGWDVEREFLAVGFHVSLRKDPALT